MTSRLWRVRFLALAFCLAGLGYAGLIALVLHDTSDSERSFSFKQGSTDTPLIHLYAELIAVDPVRSALDFRLDFATESTGVGPVYGGQADRDTVFQLTAGDSVQRLTLH